MKLYRTPILKRFPVTLSPKAARNHEFHTQQRQLVITGATKWHHKLPRNLAVSVRHYTISGSSTTAPSSPLEEESVSDESPDEFCPVHIGDIFQEKYKVVGKLGYGTNSTIWLARELQSERYVALKIYIRTPPWYSGVNREIRIYDHLGRVRSAHPGQTSIREVIDAFQIMRPDGTRHDCIVHPPLQLSLNELRRTGGSPMGLSVDMVRTSMRHLFMALDFLHTDANVTHGDVKAGNLMLTVDDKSALSDFETSEIEDPVPRKFISPERTIYASRDLQLPKDNAWGRPVLCDFGEACIGNRHEYRDIQPSIYKAPEIVLESEWSHSVDIWNAGCMVWDIFENKHLFDAHDEDGEHSARYHVAEMVAYIGLPPLEFQKRCKLSPLFFDGRGKLARNTSDTCIYRGAKCSHYKTPNLGNWKGYPSIPSISLEKSEERLEGEEKQMFLGFIRSMLRWVPEERKTARELLDDPWLNG